MLPRHAEHWQTQYQRMKRSYARLSRRYESSIDYDDDLVHFFQDCWHLKDWIKNDKTVPSNVSSSIEDVVSSYKALRIAADLANGWKHMELKPRRKRKLEGADISSKNVTIVPGRGAQTSHTVRLDDGSVLSAQDVAKQACDDWQHILHKLRLTP